MFRRFLLLCLGFVGCAAVASAGTAGAPPAPERAVVLAHRFLNIPVKADAPRRTISLVVDGQVVRAFEVELAEGDVDFWAFTDVSEWRGRPAVLRLDPVGHLGNPEVQARGRSTPVGPRALERLTLTDTIVDAGSLYREPLRPQFHFTTARGWLNDPNGLVFHAGEYHLFYQLQPFSMKSLNSDKSWGHAVSRDLLHWEELDVAIRPDRHGGAWSGSVLVDERNVAGLQSGPEPALLLYYTATGRSAMNPKAAEPADFVQRLLYSNDRGRTWRPYAGNPVLPNVTPLNRDPLVFWHAPSKRWVMVLYVGYPVSNPGNQYTAQIFNSENLKDWTYQSRIEGFFDCPMLFEIPLAGHPGETRWIIHCANMKYRAGRFDGKVFTPETELLDAHPGLVRESAYAPQVFRNVPGGRVLQIAWLYSDLPGARQQMTFPSELSLRATAAGPRLRWKPAAEIAQLYGNIGQIRDRTLDADAAPIPCGQGAQLDLETVIELKGAREIELNVRGIPLVVHALTRTLTVRGYSLPLVLKGDEVTIRVLADATSLEVFADDGLVYLPLYIPDFPREGVTVAARGAPARIVSLDVHSLQSIWERRPSASPSP